MRKSYPNCLNTNALLLPLKNKVVFVDWYGVLSKEVFLHKTFYFKNKHKRVIHLRQKLFEDDLVVKNWMRGGLTYSEVIDSHFSVLNVDEKLFVEKKLLSHCSELQLNNVLFNLLKQISNQCFIVLATDNMDCFMHSLEKLPQLGIFDSVLSSHKLGVLKRENPKRFFGMWLDSHNIPFENCLLIDDTRQNCSAFSDCGGEFLNYSYFSSEKLDEKKILDWVTN